MSPDAAGQLLMRYAISLPADYDMGIIRERVRTRGSALDDRAGLLCKAYCIREVDVDGSPANEYAPFYLWADATAAAEFLWRGSGLQHIVRDFGRPRVHTWVPAAQAPGRASARDVTHAVLRTASIAPDADLTDTVASASARADQRRDDDQVHLSVVGVDPGTWQTVEFTTYAGLDHTLEDARVFTVLHVSQPSPWS